MGELKSDICVEESKNKCNSSVNVLIANVSFLSIEKSTNRPKERDYCDEEDNYLKGEMTNEAPIKSLSERLRKRGSQLDAIIFIESVKTTTIKYCIDNKEYTSIEYLKHKILDDKLSADFYDVNIADEPTKNDVAKTVFEIYDILVNFARSGNEINIYIESNGGIRYVLTMLLSLTKTLENVYDNVHIEEITSMVLNQNPVNIKNTKDIYDTAQITEIANEFINYGRISSLKKYMQASMGKFSQGNVDANNSSFIEDARKILLSLEKISDDIQLCRTSRILEDFYGDNNLKIEIEKFNETYKDDEEFEITIFKHIINLILDDLCKIIYKDGIDEEQPVCNLVNTIEWCLEKSFVQQALTFCSERLPEYLVAKELISLGTVFQDKMSKTKFGDYEQNYYFIAHLSEFTSIIKSDLVDKEILILGKNPGQSELTDVKTFINKFEASAFANISDVNRWLARNFEQYTNIKVKVSNKVKDNPLKYTLLGQCIGDDGELCDHANLNTKRKIKEKVLPALIGHEINEKLEPQYDNARNEYSEIISDLFSDDTELTETLIRKYSREQSKKYYIELALEDGNRYIKSNKADKLQEILYVYSMCKEQRNFSNHAHVSEKDAKVALGSSDIKKLIRKLLELCTAC